MEFINLVEEMVISTKEEEICSAYGLDNIPDTFSLSCSPWEGHCNAIGDLPQFIYDDGSNPEIAKLPHCPAVGKRWKKNRDTVQKLLALLSCKTR